MAILFRQLTYFVPGTYLYVRPLIGAGNGPLGSTYLKTTISVQAAGSGGASGGAINNQNVGAVPGNGGNGGAYGRADYLPTDLAVTEDLFVGKGSLGGATVSLLGTTTSVIAGVQSVAGGNSKFGTVNKITCPGGTTSNGQATSTPTISGGTNTVAVVGGIQLFANVNIDPQSPTGPLIFAPGHIATWNTQGNNAGTAGGSASFVSSPSGKFGGDGGDINGIGRGIGAANLAGTAPGGNAPGCGGGGNGCNLASLFPVIGGPGASGAINKGQGGGGGGLAVNAKNSGGPVVGGAAGNGSDGFVQVTDYFQLPDAPPVRYIQWDLITWFHMMNMARPISLTGRYES